MNVNDAVMHGVSHYTYESGAYGISAEAMRHLIDAAAREAFEGFDSLRRTRPESSNATGSTRWARCIRSERRTMGSPGWAEGEGQERLLGSTRVNVGARERRSGHGPWERARCEDDRGGQRLARFGGAL